LPFAAHQLREWSVTDRVGCRFACLPQPVRQTIAAEGRPRFRKRVDYTEMGGAPLLGIDGAAIICHGASPVKAIKNAVRVAAEWAKAGLNEHIKTALEAEIARSGREGGRE